ncbi:glycoside hydrolase family 75 protein [Streptomyces sp. NPDC059900]|uniref:glycoside hydrolase family 75 protein n=1 Tax=Streptomyces sp. NPDC059900 TaxID=3155816 RepID=UPI00342166FD
MRTRNTALALAAGAALLVPAPLSASAFGQRSETNGNSAQVRQSSPPRPEASRASRTHAEGSVSAAALLAKAAGPCKQVSRGKYRTDDGAAENIPVCAKRGAVLWTADMDIDCDGRPSTACNRRTDPLFQDTTAFQESNGRQLSSEYLPYIVVPGASSRWNHTKHGITGGSVAAVIHRDKVLYAVVGDTGPTDLIGEASYAAAKSLGISPDPRKGGTAAGVTYLVFDGPKASPIENHRAAVTRGDALARQFLSQN